VPRALVANLAGRASVVRGLAQRMRKEDVPTSLIASKLLDLTQGAAVSRGAPARRREERVRRLVRVGSGRRRHIWSFDEKLTIIWAGQFGSRVGALLLGAFECGAAISAPPTAEGAQIQETRMMLRVHDWRSPDPPLEHAREMGVA